MAESNDQIILMKGIHKNFPGVQALEDVDFTLRKGEIHALVGENGAGKSTLSAFLAQQFTAHALPTRWIYEEDTLDAFTPFFQALREKQLNTLDLFLARNRRESIHILYNTPV